MASITAHPGIRPRRSTAVAEVPPEDDHQPTNPVPGPDERSLARTTAAVTTSLALLIGLAVAVAYGAGSLVRAVAAWVMG
jgi:hypothetical protein